MIDERTVKLEARLSVIEVAIFELFSTFYNHLPAAQIHGRHDALLASMRRRAVHGADPAVSDLLTAEIEDALREFLADLEAYVGKPRSAPQE
jgi:hypothetical protein